MANCPIDDSSVDIAIFSLSLMSTNWTDYLLEAHRTLKKGENVALTTARSMNTLKNNNNHEDSSNNNSGGRQKQQSSSATTSSTTGGGLLKIIEVRSRIPDPDKFAQVVEAIGFKFIWGDVVGEGYFCAFDFEAIEKSSKRDLAAERMLPDSSEVLTPCLYKRR